MININEKEQYIRKLNSQIIGMNELLNPKFKDIISEEKANEIEKLLKKAENLRRKLSNNEFEVAIIGLEKAGKSTFANALMGNDILPSMDARCTYTSTSIRYGKDDYAEVVFFSREEFSKKFVDNLRTMGIEHAENYDFSTLSLSKYRELFEQLSDEKKNLYRASVNEDVENVLENKDTLSLHIGSAVKVYKGSEQLEGFEFKKFIQNPAFAVAVKEITIHSSKLVDMQNAVLYDVPGFDSPTQIHREQTVQMMATADVIILIANAGKPSITGPQVQIFEGEVDQDGIPFNEKIFVFGNKADTANDSIETNIQVLKSQLEKYRIVRPEFINQRLVIGSARAKLEKDGKLPNKGVYESLKSKGIDNGIDEIHIKLEQYNDNERFEIIKKRINRIYTELEECLAPELAVLSDNSDSYINIDEISGITIKLLISAQNKIKDKLYSLHGEIPKEFAKLPLANKFLESISDINSEIYGIKEEEKEKAKNAVGTTGSNIALDEFERTLRKLKYDQIYSFFIKTIVDLAVETHNDYDKKIKDIFLEALSISSANPYYEELLNKIAEYLNNINPESKESYYRSLAERFATDLFETLIRQNFGGRDRWAAYEDRKLNLFSLGIFHSERNEELPADRQPMLYSILFHDNDSSTAEKDYVNDMIDVICRYVPGQEERIEKKFSPVLKRVASEKKEESVEYISALCERKQNSSEERFISSILNYLEIEFEEDTKNSKIDECELTAITIDYYNMRCQTDKLNNLDIDVVCSHIEQDIDILGELLLKAVIPAIQIDKAFVYYMIRSIENVLNSIEFSEPAENYQFGKFVNQNIAKIACGELADIEIEERKRRLRREICAEIQKILGNVKNYSEIKK